MSFWPSSFYKNLSPKKMLDLLKDTQNPPFPLVQYFAKAEKPMPGIGGQEWSNKHATKLKLGGGGGQGVEGASLSIFVTDCRLIWISRMQWWCSIFWCKIFSLSWNLVPTLIRMCEIHWWCSLFLFLTGNTLFGQIWSKKSKLSI